MPPTPPRCKCGWPRPLITVTTPTGRRPEGELVVLYKCPTCGAAHSAGEISAVDAARLIALLEGELARADKS